MVCFRAAAGRWYTAAMEPTPVVVERVQDLPADGRQILEGLIGRPLADDQQVFIMVLSPGSAPDEEARRRAREGLEATFRRTAAYAERHGISEAEIDAAIDEAMAHVRRRAD